MPKKLTTNEFIEKAKLVHGDKYDYSKVEYKTYHEKVTIICPTHGEFEQRCSDHLSGKGCKDCRKDYLSVKFSSNVSIFKNRANRIHKSFYNYDKVVYKNANIKVKIICPTHGEFEQTPASHLNGNGCPKCAIKYKSNKRKLTTKEFIEKSIKIHGNKYDYSKVEYGKNNHIKVTIICPTHGEFEQMPYSHLSGQGCPKCVHQISKPEMEIYNYIKSIYDGPIIQSDRSIIPPKELDIYLPELKIAFEINGEYWHNSEQKPKNYHVDKTDECKKLGIQLYHIWTRTDFDIWKSKISILLGKVETRIYARKCNVFPITGSIYKSFCNDNHLQGGGTTAKVKYGLYHENKLVSVMGFSKPRFNKNIEWELMRFCTLKNIIVVGGFSKLLKRFKSDYNPNSIISYANRDFSHGGIYGKYMKYEESTQPNYKWIKDEIEIPRYKAQKHKLQKLLGDKFIKEESEKQNMIRNGYTQCFDTGNFKFIWKK